MRVFRIVNGKRMDLPLSVVRPQVAPCVHLGGRVDAEERASRLLNAKDWRYCEHPDEPRGDIVCQCAGCGPGCKGYAR